MQPWSVLEAGHKCTWNLATDCDVAANVEMLLGLALGVNVLIRAGADNTNGSRGSSANP